MVYICFAIALIILQDTLSWHARLLITHPCMFISSSLLAFFLPPPGSPTLLLSSTETSSGCFSRFPLHILQQKVCISSTFYFCAAQEPWWSSMWYWLTESKHNTWKRQRRKMYSVRSYVFFLDFSKKWIRRCIYLEPVVIYQNIHMHPVCKWHPAFNWNLAFIW